MHAHEMCRAIEQDEVHAVPKCFYGSMFDEKGSQAVVRGRDPSLGSSRSVFDKLLPASPFPFII
jgi:hypothetical protein